jgi:hypothetical protein
MKKRLSSFDSEKDVWYYQPKIYIDTKSAESLYEEKIEFRSSLSRELAKKVVDSLDVFLEEDEKGGKVKRKSEGNFAGILKANGKVRKPVVSFFADKARVLREEIEKINGEAEERKRLHSEMKSMIEADLKEVKRLLADISLYAPGTKHSIDLRRIELEREMLSLRKERRLAEISLWKDLVFLRREMREIVFEYQALKRMAELVENGSRGNSG